MNRNLASLAAGLFFAGFAQAATAEAILRVDHAVGFEAVCDQNHYLTSATGELVATFKADLAGARGPFGGHGNEVALASIDCLSGDAGACNGWVRVTTERTITGIAFDERAITIRIQGDGLYRIGLDGIATQLASAQEDPCRDVDFYIGGCALSLVNAGSPDWAFDLGPGVPRRQSFGYGPIAGQTGRRLCTDDEICRHWPMSEQVGLTPTATGALAVLANGRVVPSVGEREAACQKLSPDCTTGEFVPLLDAGSGAYLRALSVDGQMAGSGRHADVLNFAFSVPSRDLTILGVGDDPASRRVIFRSKQGETRRTCPARPVQLPPFLKGARLFTPPQAKAERRRTMIGPASRRTTIYVDQPDKPTRGTVVNFSGGPLSAVEFLRDAVDVTALNLGATVVRPVVSGQDTLADDAWSRLRSDGKRALEADIAALEQELSDQTKYPRPLILAANSFGALPLRIALERGRLEVDHVILSVPMTAYRTPEEIIAAQEASMGGKIADRTRVEAFVKRNRLFAARAFGEGLERGNAFRTWIDGFDACRLPPGSHVYLASNDIKVSWTPPSACRGPDVTTLAGDHDLVMIGREYWTEIEATLPAMLSPVNRSDQPPRQ